MSDAKFEVIDAHCHLDFKNFNRDRDEVIQRGRKAGVTTMINSGIDLKTNRKSLELARRYDFIFATLGLNPNGLAETTDEEVEMTLDQIRDHAKEIVGVGELSTTSSSPARPHASRAARFCSTIGPVRDQSG